MNLFLPFLKTLFIFGKLLTKIMATILNCFFVSISDRLLLFSEKCDEIELNNTNRLIQQDIIKF